jgi:hypothetical protein
VQYRDAVSEARRLVKRSEEDQWRLAELTWEQVSQGGHSMQSWADDIEVSKAHAGFLSKVWEKYGVYPVDDRPPFRDAYAEAKGMPVDAAERRQMEADRNVANRSVAERARMAAELLEDEDVAEEVEGMQLGRRGPIGEPLPEPTDFGRRVANKMAHKLETDLATGALRSAAGSLAEAILCKEKFGVDHPDQEREALDAIERYLAAYKAGDHVSDNDRDWLTSIGVEL